MQQAQRDLQFSKKTNKTKNISSCLTKEGQYKGEEMSSCMLTRGTISDLTLEQCSAADAPDLEKDSLCRLHLQKRESHQNCVTYTWTPLGFTTEGLGGWVDTSSRYYNRPKATKSQFLGERITLMMR